MSPTILSRYSLAAGLCTALRATHTVVHSACCVHCSACKGPKAFRLSSSSSSILRMLTVQQALVRVAFCCLLLGFSTASIAGRSTGPPTAWQFITSRNELTAIAAVLQNLGLDKTLQEPFTGTLLLPNNDALTAYLSQAKGLLNDTTVTNLFYSKLMKYHTLMRCASSQLPNTTTFSTRHIDPVSNRYHRVTFIANGTAAERHKSSSSAAVHSKQQQQQGAVLQKVETVRDEQAHDVTIAAADNEVLGGGVIHVITGVLQPSDLFPSLSAAISSSSLFGTVAELFEYVKRGGSNAAEHVDMLLLLEGLPGTLLLPIDTAFLDLDFTLMGVNDIIRVLQYHMCPSPGNTAGLISYPFLQRRPGNSCTTLLGAAQGRASLRLTFKSIINPYPTSPSMIVEFPTVTPSLATARATPARAIGQANIIIPNIATPLHVIHGVDTLLTPPAGSRAP